MSDNQAMADAMTGGGMRQPPEIGDFREAKDGSIVIWTGAEHGWLKYHNDYSRGYAAGLDAAREAIKALCHQHPLIWPTDEGPMEALDAAIDALRDAER